MSIVPLKRGFFSSIVLRTQELLMETFSFIHLSELLSMAIILFYYLKSLSYFCIQASTSNIHCSLSFSSQIIMRRERSHCRCVSLLDSSRPNSSFLKHCVTWILILLSTRILAIHDDDLAFIRLRPSIHSQRHSRISFIPCLHTKISRKRETRWTFGDFERNFIEMIWK